MYKTLLKQQYKINNTETQSIEMSSTPLNVTFTHEVFSRFVLLQSSVLCEVLCGPLFVFLFFSLLSDLFGIFKLYLFYPVTF